MIKKFVKWLEEHAVVLGSEGKDSVLLAMFISL